METILDDIRFFGQGTLLPPRNAYYKNGYQFIFVKSGRVTVKVDNTLCELQAPSVFLINPFERVNWIASSEDYTRFVIVFNKMSTDEQAPTEVLAMLRYRPSALSNKFVLDESNARSFNHVCEILIQERTTTSEFSDLVIQNLAPLLLVILYRLYPLKNIAEIKRISQIQTYMEENSNKDIDIIDIADHFLVSPSYINQLFKKTVGVTPKYYLSCIRLYNAQSLLEFSDDSIKDICFACGYNDENNFIRQFRQRFLITPLQFRIDQQKKNRRK
ncbi:MAG: AraC family transcriptional regulator [Clostridia bacterium]